MTIGKQDSVKTIKVDLKDKVITINFNDNQRLEDSVISQLINDLGYTVREITDEKNDTSIWIQAIIPSLSLFTSLGTLLSLCVTCFDGNAWYGSNFGWFNWFFSIHYINF